MIQHNFIIIFWNRLLGEVVDDPSLLRFKWHLGTMSLSTYSRGTQSCRKVYMPLRACMGGCNCLSINLQPCPLEDLVAASFFKDMITQNLTPTARGVIKPHATVICNVWVDQILPSTRQWDKCFVLLFLYLAIKYLFIPGHVLPWIKGSTSGRLFIVPSRPFIRGAKICIYLLCNWHEEILGSILVVLYC